LVLRTYCLTSPDLRCVGQGLYTAFGSNEGLLIHCSHRLELRREAHTLDAKILLHPACAELQGQFDHTW
jgi:hypothetical protein